MKFQVPENVRTNDYWLLQKSCTQWHYANLGNQSSKIDCEMCWQHLPPRFCIWHMLIDSVSSENSPSLSVFLMRETSPTLETSCVFFIETMDTMQNADIRQPLFLHVYQHGILLLPLWGRLGYQPLLVTECTTCFNFQEWSFCPHIVFICSTWLA